MLEYTYMYRNVYTVCAQPNGFQEMKKMAVKT